MKKVCLKAGLSYVARGVSCVKGSPIYVEDNMAEKLLKTGRFEIVDVEPVSPVAAAPAQDSPVPGFADSSMGFLEPGFTAPALDYPVLGSEDLVSRSPALAARSASITSMRKDELIAFAEAQGISIGDCKNNEERIQRIQSEMDIGAFARLASEEEGET